MNVKAMLLATLCLAAVMCAVGPGAGVEALQATDGLSGSATERTSGDVVGASVSHPEGWAVERENVTYDDTYGYTLWYPDTDEAHDHGGMPALRVALAYDLEPGQIEAEVRRTIGAYPDLNVGRQTVSVGQSGYEGVAVGPIPGSTPSMEVYVPVNDRVYLINVYAREPGQEGLGEADRELLSTLEFSQPSRPVSSLGLERANAPEALYPVAGEASAEPVDPLEQKWGPGVSPVLEGEARAVDSRRRRGGGEKRIAEGCWRAGSGFFVQTLHGFKANSSRKDGIPRGWSRIGVPNFWGQFTHGNLGFGRCTKPNWANDKYAIDFPLDKGDVLFSPFNCGRVTFAGRNRTHADYGVLVSIKSCNGKYVSLSAHLSGVRRGLNKRDKVGKNTIIGYAGKSGGGRIAVGPVHVHQAFYRNPSFNPDGSPYGGAGLRVDRWHYVGTAARKAKNIRVRSHTYRFDRVKPRFGAFCREGRRCGEGYKVSN